MVSLGTLPEQMMDVMEDCEVWRLNLELLRLQPLWKAGHEERKEKRKNRYKHINNYYLFMFTEAKYKVI